ncbi:MAG: hypothetical protein HY908_30340 [Myxococcales bacterium]|nr:hypothetical protein [Myxococcales bacterium]
MSERERVSDERDERDKRDGRDEPAAEYGPYDAAHPPPFDFDAWTELGVRLLGRDAVEQLEVLADRDVEPELWRACDAFWVGALVEQIAAGNLGLARTYADACVRATEARAKLPPELEGAPSASIDETGFMMALHPAPALPFGPATSAPSKTPAPAKKSVTPTAAGASATARSVAPKPPPAERAARRGAGEGPADRGHDLDATSVDLSIASLDETLPFVGARSLRKELAELAASGGRPAVEPAAPPVGAASVEAPPAAAAPRAPESRVPEKAAATASPFPELTLEQFASLCATCEVHPDRVTEVEQRFGVRTAEARRALDAHWVERMRADASLHRGFYARFHEYRAWLETQRRGG